MARRKFSNAGSCVLASAVSAVDLSIALEPGKGSKFPTSDFRILMRRTDLTYEIAHVTSRSGDTLTIANISDRGLEGTAAITFSIGDYVSAVVTKDALETFAQIDQTNTFSATQTFSKPIVMSASSIKMAAEISVPSASTLDVSADTGNQILITGTTQVDAITSGYRGPIFARFAGVLTLKHGANLDCPGAADIVTAAGDRCVFMPNAAGSGWIVWAFDKASGKPIVDSSPPGMVAHFAMATAPNGWLKANGAAVSRTTYAALFSAIGTIYGVGDGSTTFNVPELRGEFVRGWDDARGIDSGRAIATSQTDAMQGHQHPNGGATSGLAISGGAGWYSFYPGGTGSPTTDGVNGTPRTAAETRPRNVALLACIKF